MGQSLVKKKRIKVIDLTPSDKCSDYLRPTHKINCRIDEDLNITRLKIRAEDWFISTIRLWPKEENAKKLKIFRSSKFEVCQF